MKLGVPTLANHAGLDALCLSAEQGSQKPTGYLIVDNGGAYDGSPERHPWMELAAARGASVELYRPGRNLGVAASWNWMLERTLDEGLVIANDDVSLGPSAFADLVDALATRPFATADGWACFAQSPECTRRVGWYDENFWPAYYEDNDYALRMHRAGIVPHVIAAESITHVGWATTRTLGDPEWLREGRERNRHYFMAKWCPDDTNMAWPTAESACDTPFRGAPPAGWSERKRVAQMLMRWDILNAVAGERFPARMADGTVRGRYLEIGVSDGSCMRRVNVSEKWGVDPEPQPQGVKAASIFVARTSDTFFAEQRERGAKFNLIFIDGDHTAEQVYRDVQGALSVLATDGAICLHDCNPSTEAMQRVPPVQSEWTGDCWKAVARLRAEGEHTVRVVNTDYGVAVILPYRPEAPISLPRPWQELAWEDLVAERRSLLGLIEPADWENFFPCARK